MRLQPGVARGVAGVSLPGRGHVRDVINCYCRWLQAGESIEDGVRVQSKAKPPRAAGGYMDGYIVV